MSYQDAWAAMHMEMPLRVPRTEYSADFHWPLVNKVTGFSVSEHSPAAERTVATKAFMKAWDYGYVWNTMLGAGELDACRTTMGHASYRADGSDFNTNINCPFEDVEDVLEFDPLAVYPAYAHGELVKRFNENYKAKCEFFPDAVNTTGTYITLVSGLLEIFGWDMFLMGLGVDAKAMGEVANNYARWVQPYFNALADCDAPIINIHDDITWTSGAFVHPDWYRTYVFPNYKKYFAPLLEAGKKIIFTSDGTFTQFVDDLADAGVHGFVLEPTTDMNYIAEKYGRTHVFIGNADTRILLRGTKEDIYNEVKRCVDIGKNCPGFFMAVGNHIPANTPVENALYYNEVFEKLRKR